MRDPNRSSANQTDGGLPRFVGALRSILPELRIDVGQVFGEVDAAGLAGPGRSSAAMLCLDSQSWWVPWPIVESIGGHDGVAAALFLWGGQPMLFPTIRLGVMHEGSRATSPSNWEFLQIDEWLYSAFCEWQFPFIPVSHRPRTVFGRLNERLADPDGAPSAKGILRLLGNAIRFAIAGRRNSRVDRRLNLGSLTLRIPARSGWLRPLGYADDEDARRKSQNGETVDDGDIDDLLNRSPIPLWLAAARSAVLTARIFRPDRETDAAIKSVNEGAGVPRLCTMGHGFQYQFESSTKGIDPIPFKLALMR